MAMKKDNSIKVVLALLGVIVLTSVSCSAYAQGVPPAGSYNQTCNAISMLDPFTLTGNCQQENGGFEQSALDLRVCAGGSDISNNNGILQCAEHIGVPSGSYINSCEFISLSGNILSANCANFDATIFPFTQLNLGTCGSGSDISNNNGQLQCNT
jgi:hypothetical protein